MFDAAFLREFSCDTGVHFKEIIPEDHPPIILELFLILFTTNYSKNHSSIMYACLALAQNSPELLLAIKIFCFLTCS